MSKLSNADSENSEPQLWLDFAEARNYILKEQNRKFANQSEEVGKLINYMINNPGKFGL